MKIVFSVVVSGKPVAKKYTVEGERIVVGRAPDSQVVLDDPIVSGHHAEFRLDPFGQVSLFDLESTNGTIVNGKQVTKCATLMHRDILSFGEGGPELLIWEIDDGAVLLPTTKTGGETRALLVDLQDTARRWGTVGLFGTCSTIILVGFLFILLINRLYDVREGTRNIADATEHLADTTSRQGHQIGEQGQQIGEIGKRIEDMPKLNAQRVFEKYGAAVFHVEVPGEFVATAFAIDPTGLFATNAHVAKPISQLLKKEVPAYVVAQGGKTRYQVIQAGFHPDYDKESKGKYTPDVGWLKVRLPPGTQLTSSTLASDAALKSTQAGAACCYIGFPSYQESDYSTPSQVVARVYVGNIVRNMNAHREHSDFQGAFVYEHNMHSWGGASGSPIFNGDGNVIALHFSGASVQDSTGEWIRSVASSKYAIRVDRLRECLPK